MTFDPNEYFTWHSFGHAEGAGTAALTYADDDPVPVFKNETGESDWDVVASSARSPRWVSSVSDLNGKPAVAFSYSSRRNIMQSPLGSSPDYTNGVSVVVIYNQRSTSGKRYLVDGIDGTGRNNFGGPWSGGDTRLGLWAGGAWIKSGSGTNTLGGHIASTLWPGSSEVEGIAGIGNITVDGTTILTGAVEDMEINGLTIGGRYGSNSTASSDADIAFVGIYEGDVTAHPDWGYFLWRAQEHYGLTVAGAVEPPAPGGAKEVVAAGTSKPPTSSTTTRQVLRAEATGSTAVTSRATVRQIIRTATTGSAGAASVAAARHVLRTTVTGNTTPTSIAALRQIIRSSATGQISPTSTLTVRQVIRIATTATVAVTAAALVRHILRTLVTGTAPAPEETIELRQVPPSIPGDIYASASPAYLLHTATHAASLHNADQAHTQHQAMPATTAHTASEAHPRHRAQRILT